MTPLVEGTMKSTAAVGDDVRLVRECLSGSEQAWSLLIEKYKALIYSIPVKCGLPAHEAADVFQTTCMELLVRLPELREPRALPQWLIQVAYHQCCVWKRRSQRLVSSDSEDGVPEPEVSAIAETLMQQVHEEQMLRDAIATLTPQCQRLIELLFFETPSRPYREVAGELGLAAGSIGFVRQKCIERLRRKLDELGFE
jgi:RNA polymerase sigma factor (sigma-70 family)